MYLHPPSIPPSKARPERIKKLGLSYKGVPIVDFGIGKGSIKVPPGSQYAYWLAKADKWGVDEKSQQSPDDHYWIYFTTILGHELILDCGMHTYGLGLTVTSDFLPPEIFTEVRGPIPGYFIDKHVAIVDKKIRTTKQRFSVLHDASLAKLSTDASGLSLADHGIVMDFMAKVKGSEATPDEILLALQLIPINFERLEKLLKKHSWDSWPKDEFTGYDGLDDGVLPVKGEADPILIHPEYMTECVRREYLKKWLNRKHKQEEISNLEDVLGQYQGRS